MNAAIISCGTELVTGQCLDTNSAWLAQRLTALGVEVSSHVTVGDEQERVADTIRKAQQEAQLVIMTGGLGPTADDLTRDALSGVLNQPLELHAQALAAIQAFFEKWGREMPVSNRVQAMIPRVCEVIPNPRGTAPGIAHTAGERMLFALPGVPAEMKAMFVESIEPRLIPQTRGERTLTKRLLCFGISEASLGEAIVDLMARGRNPLVGTTASEAILSVRILARGADDASAELLISRVCAEVRRRLGSSVFGEGDDTLQSAVAAMLIERRLTVATAESCTGGLLAKRLTDIPGSSASFLRGYVTYSNESKTELLGIPSELIAVHGAVSEPVAEAMADRCRRIAKSDLALAITGIAGPGGGSPDKPVGLVHVALADRDSTVSRRLRLGEHLTRGEIRDRACKSALNLLRLRLLGER